MMTSAALRSNRCDPPGARRVLVGERLRRREAREVLRGEPRGATDVGGLRVHPPPEREVRPQRAATAPAVLHRRSPTRVSAVRPCAEGALGPDRMDATCGGTEPRLRAEAGRTRPRAAAPRCRAARRRAACSASARGWAPGAHAHAHTCDRSGDRARQRRVHNAYSSHGSPEWRLRRRKQSSESPADSMRRDETVAPRPQREACAQPQPPAARPPGRGAAMAGPTSGALRHAAAAAPA